MWRLSILVRLFAIAAILAAHLPSLFGQDARTPSADSAAHAALGTGGDRCLT